MTSPASPVRKLRKRLSKLRRRVRTLFALQGLTRWLTAAVVVLLLFFVADWLLDLPLGVRRFIRLGLLDRPPDLKTFSWIVMLGVAVWLTIFSTRRRLGAAPLFAFAAAGIVGLLGWLAVRLLAPVTVHLEDEELALSVEQRYRRLNDRLAAALDFEEELGDPTRGESEAMMRAVLVEAEAEAKGLAFTRAVSARRTLAWTGVALAALAVAAGVAFAARETVSLWAERSLLLEDRSWPQATTLVAVDVVDGGRAVEHPVSQPFEVPIGQTLVVHAEALGDVPEEVALVDRVEGARSLATRMFPVPDRPGLFRVEIRDVRRGFAFVLRGGDDVDDVPLYGVEVTVPPRVTGISARLAYPAYLEQAEELVEDGNLRVPEGTSVTLAFETDVPVETARVLLRDDVLNGRSTEAGGRHFEVSFVAVETMRYRIQLATAEGRESDPAASTYEVRVARDSAPRVRWVVPRGTLETTPKGRVPVIAVAEDDHAVVRLVLEVRRGETILEPVRELVPYGTPPTEGDGHAVPALDGALGRSEVLVYHPLEVASLVDAEGRPPTAPARIALRIRAWDSKGQIEEGSWTAVDVYTPVDVERALAERRTAVRAELAAVKIEQRARREQVAGLLDVPLGAPETDLLKSVVFAQSKIAQDADTAVRGLLEIFNAWVYGRISAENPTERILAILDRHHRTTYGQLPKDAASDFAFGDPAFPYALYAEVLRAWKSRQIFDTGLLERMLRVLEDAVTLASDAAPAAHRALLLAVEAIDSTHSAERLAAAASAQDRVLATLDRLLDAMRSWQSLNDVILKLRRIVEEQEALNERVAVAGDGGEDENE